MGAMGSVQESTERNGEVGGGDVEESASQALREDSKDEEVWWMSEDQGINAEGMQGTPADSWSVEMEDLRRRLREELEVKEKAWAEEKRRMAEEHDAQLECYRRAEEQRKVEVDMLEARALELEVVNVMAKWASVGVQVTSEDDAPVCRREEEKLVSVCTENEELKRELEQLRSQMRISSREDQQKCVTCEFCSRQIDVQVQGVCREKRSTKHEDDLRREYESQIRNVRELRCMYEERMKAAEEQSRKLREELQEKTRRLELSRRRCSELRAHSQELEALLGEQESVARGLQTRLTASVEEGRTLASQLATVNKLFGRLGDTAELDFERLRLLQHSCEGGEDSSDCAANSSDKVEGGEEVSELKEIAASLPKVWRLLVELLGEEHKEEEKVSEGAKETSDGCFDSIPTPYGPRLVISVSRTFIRLKDLILEKKSLQNELGRIRDLNGRLESKLKQQERRLATVKVELKRTWGLVARMRAQHKQLHTSEQVLRYELQQKRKLLGELKQELEYCREKWEMARLKNSQSEKEWQLLREEFRARRSADAITESTEANSPESGFSDGRGEDEEEDAGAEYSFSEQEGENLLDLQQDACYSVADDDVSLGLDEATGGSDEVDSADLVDARDLREHETEKETESQKEEERCPEVMSYSAEVRCTSEEPNCNSTEGANASTDGAASLGVESAGSSKVEGGVAPRPADVEMTVEERLQARAERLRRLEEQCNLLFRKVTRTTTRSAELSSRLEELHEQYGEQHTAAGEEGSTQSPTLPDTETGERPPTPSSMVQLPPTPPPLPSFLPAIRLPSLLHHFTPIARPSTSSVLSNSTLQGEGSEGHETGVEGVNQLVEEPLATQELENPINGEETSTEEPGVSMENLTSRIQAIASSVSLLSNLSEEPSEEDESPEMEMEELGLSLEESSNGGGEATESSMAEDAMESYMAEMSSTIYDLHHGPLFDDGNSHSDEEECGGAVEEEDEETDEEDLGITSGSIGVASLLLQQLPKRMDILRRERHTLEQRLEEGEAALVRALAGTAEAERRARVLERGLVQAQERLQVLEMEAAVERNERLLEIRSALEVSGEGNPSDLSEANREQSNSLQEEIDSLQQKTLAQIAGLQAAAAVSRTQKEQLNNLNDEVERQEKVVHVLEGELASLRKERGEQAETLEDTRGRLKDALAFLAQKEEESEGLRLLIDKLKTESDESNREKIALFSRLAAAESEVSRLNAEMEQLKDDSDRLRDAVIRLTGEKEALFRANHNLEEMRRLVLQDSRWVADKESERCTACGVSFSLTVRRHHCRSCGRIFCGACSSHWLDLHNVPQNTSLVAGVVESLMGVAGLGKCSRACADCFAAYCADVNGETSTGASAHKTDSSKLPENGVKASSDAGLSGEAAEGGMDDDDDDDDLEDFSMISEEEVSFSQCTPYVPNPRTLQYWTSCEIQCGVTSSVKDLLSLADSGAPGKGKGEEVWVRAGSIYSVPILIDDTHVNIFWEFSTNPNSIAFSVLYKTGADIPMSCALIVVPTTRVNSHLNPIHGRLRPKRAGVYVLMFDNSSSSFTGKTITYTLRAEVPSKGASGRESVASSCRSSAEPFPDLPIHQEGVAVEREDDRDGDAKGEFDGE